MPDKKETTADKKVGNKPVAKPAAAKASGGKKPAAKKPATKKPATKPSAAVRKKTTTKKRVVKTDTVGKKAVAANPAAAKKVIKVKAKTRQRSAERRELREKRPDGYFYAVGRRKRAVSQTRLWPDQKKIEVTVNGKNYGEYFTVYDLREACVAPLKAIGMEGAKVEAKVSGGGMRGQAEAVRLGVSRALLLVNPDHRMILKKLGFLTRDPREKERKKYGLKKARRAPQWSKR